MKQLAFDNTKGTADLVTGPGGFVSRAGLATAVLMSLFSDRRAEEGDLEEGDDRRGWWADEFLPPSVKRLGSRLWILRREKLTAKTPRRAELFMAESLAWLVTEQIARAVRPSAWVTHGILFAKVEILRGVSGRWETLWEGELNAAQ